MEFLITLFGLSIRKEMLNTVEKKKPKRILKIPRRKGVFKRRKTRKVF